MGQETHARITTNITDTHSFITDTLSLILVLRRLLGATAQSLPRETLAALYAVATTAALTAMHTAGGSGRSICRASRAVAAACLHGQNSSLPLKKPGQPGSGSWKTPTPRHRHSRNHLG